MVSTANATTAATPAQLAEAPPSTHPVIEARLVEQLQDVTLLLATGDAVTFTPDREPREALDALRAVADDLAERADKLRPTVHPTTTSSQRS